MYSTYDYARRNVNIANVREQIERKNSDIPYIPTFKHVDQVWTDYDVFPYPRYFRGIHTSSEPIVAEREAGWMFRNDYKPSKISDIWKAPYPNHCFQSACSTIRPCHPKPDKDELNDVYNNWSNVKFR
uniref:Uncharacterized protein n=1 Tax=viral metagenome TaxID=1070528 RepID=A0A6C0H2I6_9ZZZZ